MSFIEVVELPRTLSPSPTAIWSNQIESARTEAAVSIQTPNVLTEAFKPCTAKISCSTSSFRTNSRIFSIISGILAKKSSLIFTNSKKYTFEKKGNVLQKNYSVEYSKKYHQVLGHQIEDRFQRAYKHVGDIWYSAWIEAGQPFFK